MQLEGILSVIGILIVTFLFFRHYRNMKPVVMRQYVEKRRKSPFKREYIPVELRRAVMARYGEQCSMCGNTEPLEIHHRTPVCKGGTNDIDNLEVLCRDCNRRLGAGLSDYGHYKQLQNSLTLR